MSATLPGLTFGVQPWSPLGRRNLCAIAYGFDRLSERLSASGASEPQAEDWGWSFTFDAPAKALFLGCGNVAGENDQWLIFLRERTGFLARLIGRSGADSDAKRRVIVALDAALRAEPSVSEIEWFSEGPDRQELDHAPHPD